MKNKVQNFVGGFLVVRRINYFKEASTGTLEDRQPALPWSHEQILAHYKGFEGQPWPEDTGKQHLDLQQGLLPLERHHVVAAYYERISRLYPCDLIYLQFTDLPVGQILNQPNFSFVGYDYGYYLSDLNFYSALFNEVIYGKYETLRNCTQSLNDHLLIPSLDVVAMIDDTRRQLLATEADLETDEICVPIAIHYFDTL
jgi:hypothetical protein